MAPPPLSTKNSSNNSTADIIPGYSLQKKTITGFCRSLFFFSVNFSLTAFDFSYYSLLLFATKRCTSERE